jgi:hypothetical protein
VSYEDRQSETVQVSRAEYEALRRDAERYRWLRCNVDLNDLSPCGPEDFAENYPAHVDAEVDAAINMPANGEGGE